MICPSCGANDDKVIDSRPAEGGGTIRRRRECLACRQRFTTYERLEETRRLSVIKRDGTRVPFSRESVRKGIVAACGKRPIPEADKEQLITRVEESLYAEFDREVQSEEIGRRVALGLRDLDEIAYIRFVSEYEKFADISELAETVRRLGEHVRDAKNQQRLFDEQS